MAAWVVSLGWTMFVSKILAKQLSTGLLFSISRSSQSSCLLWVCFYFQQRSGWPMEELRISFGTPVLICVPFDFLLWKHYQSQPFNYHKILRLVSKKNSFLSSSLKKKKRKKLPFVCLLFFGYTWVFWTPPLQPKHSLNLITEISEGWDSCVGAGAGDYLKMHQTTQLLSVPPYMLPAITPKSYRASAILCSGLHCKTHLTANSQRGCDRKGLGKANPHPMPEMGQLALQIKPWYISSNSAQAPIRTLSPALSEERQTSSPFFLLLFFSPTKQNLPGLHLFHWTVSSF